MNEFPTWFSRVLIIGLLGWMAVSTQINSTNYAALKTSVDGVNARVTMLVQFMIPADGRRAEVKR